MTRKLLKVYIKPHTLKGSRTYRVISESGRILRRGLPSWESAREWVRQQNADLPRATEGVRRNPAKRGKGFAVIIAHGTFSGYLGKQGEIVKGYAAAIPKARKFPTRAEAEAAARSVMQQRDKFAPSGYVSVSVQDLSTRFIHLIDSDYGNAVRRNPVRDAGYYVDGHYFKTAKEAHSFARGIPSPVVEFRVGGWVTRVGYFSPRHPIPRTVASFRAALKRQGKTKVNPSPRAADEAARRLEAFTGHAATKEMRARARPIKVGLAIGKLSGVMYEATRDGETSQYFHRFKKSSRPLLIADHDGSQIGIVGGRYRFTDRGIVDD